MTLPMLAARLQTLKTWERQIGASEVYDDRIEELETAQSALMSDFVLSVANGALKGSDAQMGASMLCEAFQIRSSTH